MQLSRFRSSTGLVMILALSASQVGLGAIPVAAQDGAPPGQVKKVLDTLAGNADLPRQDGRLRLCALGDPVPCVMPTGEVAGEAQAQAAAQTMNDQQAIQMSQAILAADAKGTAGAAPAQQTPAAPEADGQAAAQAGAPEGNAPEAQAGSQAGGEAAAQAEPPAAPEAQAREGAAEAPEGDGAQPEEAQADAPEAPVADGTAEGGQPEAQAKTPDAAAQDQAPAEAEAKANAQADAPAEDTASAEAGAEAAQGRQDGSPGEGADATADANAELTDKVGKMLGEAKDTAEAAAEEAKGAAGRAADAVQNTADQAAGAAENAAPQAGDQQAAGDADAGQPGGAEADAAAGETTEARADAGLTDQGAAAEADLQARLQEQAQGVAAAAAAAAGVAQPGGNADQGQSDQGQGDQDQSDQAQDGQPQGDQAAGAQADAGADAQPQDQQQPSDAKVVEETIGEGDVRTAAQDFQEKIRTQQGQTAQEEPKDKGLSTTEKVALFGLGALAVGALLNNGDKVVATSGDRVVAKRDDGSVYIVKNDDEILRQPGSKISTRQYDDGSTLTTVQREDGVEVRTIRDAEGRVLRRTKVLPDGTSVVLFDDTQEVQQVDVASLPRQQAPEVQQSSGDLDAAMRQQLSDGVDRRFSLGQVRNIRAVRELVPIIDLDNVTFDTGSAAIRPSEAEELVDLGQAMKGALDENPGEVFLIEGHTDATGSAAYNLTLSDRRAESLALALTEYFDIPPENMVVQGYGEQYLKVPTLESERANRRVAVRRITPLLTASAN